MILRSKPTPDIPLSIDDLVDIDIRHEGQKRAQWSSPCSVLLLDSSALTITVPAPHVRTMSASIEDLRPFICDESLNALLRSSYEELDLTVSILPTPKTHDDTARIAADHAQHIVPSFEAEFASYHPSRERVDPVACERVEVH